MADLRFLIVTWESSADRRHSVVAGRCYDGPIVLGDSFDRLLTGGHMAPVALRVEEIRSYGHLLDHIEPALNGELLLSGTPSFVEQRGESFLIGKQT